MRELDDDGKKIDSGSGGAHVLTSVREAVTSPAQRCVIMRFHVSPLGGRVRTPTNPVRMKGRKVFRTLNKGKEMQMRPKLSNLFNSFE